MLDQFNRPAPFDGTGLIDRVHSMVLTREVLNTSKDAKRVEADPNSKLPVDALGPLNSSRK